jgi:hypothetical protein
MANSKISDDGAAKATRQTTALARHGRKKENSLALEVSETANTYGG